MHNLIEYDSDSRQNIRSHSRFISSQNPISSLEINVDNNSLGRITRVDGDYKSHQSILRPPLLSTILAPKNLVKMLDQLNNTEEHSMASKSADFLIQKIEALSKIGFLHYRKTINIRIERSKDTWVIADRMVERLQNTLAEYLPRQFLLISETISGKRLQFQIKGCEDLLEIIPGSKLSPRRVIELYRKSQINCKNNIMNNVKTIVEKMENEVQYRYEQKTLMYLNTIHFYSIFVYSIKPPMVEDYKKEMIKYIDLKYFNIFITSNSKQSHCKDTKRLDFIFYLDGNASKIQ